MNTKLSLLPSAVICRWSLLILLICAVSSCNERSASQGESAEDGEWTWVRMPDISQQPITLRVANVVNLRFKQLTDSQIEQILQRSQQLVKQNFDIEVRFSAVETLAIEEVFKRLDPHVFEKRRSEIVNLDLIDSAAREKMQQSLYKTLTNYADNEQSVIDFAQPYLLNPDKRPKDFIELSYALVDAQVSRLAYWQKQMALDDRPVLSSDAYHEWVWWDSLGYSDLPYDVMLTNQLVASAEYYAMDVHSSMRGGITAGTTTYSRSTKFNSYAFVMVYPLLNDADLLSVLRDDETYSEEQIINYSAALLTHELGHLLLHLGHPFGNKHCIMSPTVMLNYRDWYDNLDAKKCAVGSSKAMTPDVAKIEYNRNW